VCSQYFFRYMYRNFFGVDVPIYSWKCMISFLEYVIFLNMKVTPGCCIQFWKLENQTLFFSSPVPKSHVSLCHHSHHSHCLAFISSLVYPLKQMNQIKPNLARIGLSKFYLTAWLSIQDGYHYYNINFIVHYCILLHDNKIKF
jgi:hypothetical protein